MTSEEEQFEQRKANLEALKTLGVEAYPHKFERRDTISDLVAAHGEHSHDELEQIRPETITSGRILAIRSFGKANFLAVSDGHARIQIYIRQDSLPPLDFDIFKLLDFGDWVGVEGRLFRTRTNELTIWASRLHFLAKCLLPLPEKWHGLTDVEIRYRRRAGASVCDASQRPRHGFVPAHRARAVPETPDRRRSRAGVRDQPQLQKR